MTTQFRLYRLREGVADAFVDAWRSGVVPLRRTFGYAVWGGWLSTDRDRFAWTVSYEGPLTWQQAEERYYGSPERAALDPDPASFILDAETWFVDAAPPDP